MSPLYVSLSPHKWVPYTWVQHDTRPSYASPIVCHDTMNEWFCVWRFLHMSPTNQAYCVRPSRMSHIVRDPHKHGVKGQTQKEPHKHECDSHKHCVWRRYEWVILCLTIPTYESYESVYCVWPSWMSISCVTLLSESYCVWRRYEWVILCVTIPTYESYESGILRHTN